jgi:hypothetical protein
LLAVGVFGGNVAVLLMLAIVALPEVYLLAGLALVGVAPLVGGWRMVRRLWSGRVMHPILRIVVSLLLVGGAGVAAVVVNEVTLDNQDVLVVALPPLALTLLLRATGRRRGWWDGAWGTARLVLLCADGFAAVGMCVNGLVMRW